MCRAALADLVTGARHRHRNWKFDVEVQVATDGSAEAVNILNSTGPIAVKRWVKALARRRSTGRLLNDLGEPVPGPIGSPKRLTEPIRLNPVSFRVGTEPNCHARVPCSVDESVHQVAGTCPWTCIAFFDRAAFGSNTVLAPMLLWLKRT